MQYRAFSFVAVVVILSSGLAFGQNTTETCEAAAAAYKALAATTTDPDMDMANNLMNEGLSDCKAGKVQEGIDKINRAMFLINDKKHTE